MKCPVCGTDLNIITVEFTEFTQIKSGKCPECTFSNNWAEIKKEKKGEVFLSLLKSLLDQGLLNNLLDAPERKKLSYSLLRINKKLEKLNKLDVQEPEFIPDLEKFFRMKKLMIDKLERSVQIGTPIKTLLEEMKLMDVNIISERKLQKLTSDDQKVFIFEFDGKDHIDEVKNSDKPV
jgi:hypothetical protein